MAWHRILYALAAAFVVSLAGQGAYAASVKASAARPAALACPSANATPIAPETIRGVITRVQTNPLIGRSIQYTIQPNLENLDLRTWMRNLEEAGVNIAEINIQPSAALVGGQTISDHDWDAYLDAIFVPYEQMSDKQRDAYKGIRDKIGARNGAVGITTDQEYKALIVFLSRLEALKKDGGICGNVQFIVGERRWFPNPRPWDDKFRNEAMFAETMADFLKKASSAGVDHWLAGILFPEHANTDMSQLLPITVDLAARINALTDNWLKSHLMALAGGGFGDEFNGINDVQCPAKAADPGGGFQFTCKPGHPFEFFDLISKQTGSFAFAYKLFNFKTTTPPSEYCTKYLTGCDPKDMTATHWMGYLSDPTHGLGFKDLAAFVNRNAAAYPRAANVIFIGNSSDSIFKMVKVEAGPTGARVVPGPQIIALSALFQNAARNGGGWSGHMFVDAYGDQDRLSDAAHMSIDNGSYLFYVDYSPFNFKGGATVRPNPQTQAFWRAWPMLPPQ